MEKPSDLSHSEYLHIAYDINALNISEDKIKDCGINVADFFLNRDPSHKSSEEPQVQKSNGEKQLDLN